MSLQNLREDALYALLPEGIISLDEQRLIQAVVGGYQDRVDDLRSYASKVEFLINAQGLPEIDGQGTPRDNAVIVQVQSPKGKVYPRSLDIKDDTPAADDPALFAWGTNQLQLDDEHVAISAAYGVDKLRLVDASVLNYLAATVGAILYQTAAQDPNNADSDARRLLATWFPRLAYKGTAESFESLGRLLGFDDVRMIPLWQRLSPRVPNDAGDPANNQDFSQVPDYWPKQVRDVYYDPLNLTDGPYYTWNGTMTGRLGTNHTDFYTQVINGFNPFVKVSVVGTAPFDPTSGTTPYILTGGGPEAKAYVNPSGTGLRFEAIAAGSSFNGMALYFEDRQDGTYRSLSITERLSALKYRSSYFDLALTMDFDHALQQFGTEVVTTNKDLALNGTIANFGTNAVSPYRPWTAGSMTQDMTQRDWTTQSNGNVAVYTPRHQAGLTDRQYDTQALAAAGLQVIQAMEEVRPATRHIREANVGFLIREDVGYAPYCSSGSLFSTLSGVGTYWGTISDYPAPAHLIEAGTVNPSFLYAVEFSAANSNAFQVTWQATVGGVYRVQSSSDLINWTNISANITATGTTETFTVLVGLPATFFRVYNVTGSSAATILSSGFTNTSQMLVQERDPFNQSYVRVKSADLTMVGTYNYDNLTYLFTFPAGIGSGVAVHVAANYQTLSTEVVRGEPHGTNRPTVLAFTADGGLYSVNQANVAAMVRGWNVDAFLHGGDNNYYDGEIGDFYRNIINWRDFIDDKKFFVCPGNHDFFNGTNPADSSHGFDLSTQTNFFDYFPGNGRYYDVVIGNVHLFSLNAAYNTSDNPTWNGDGRPRVEPDGNWCESPYTPIGTKIQSPTAASTIPLVSGITYTVHVDPNYGDQSETFRPSYVVWNSGTYRDGQSFTYTTGTVLVYGEPTIDPAPSQAILRIGRKYRVIAQGGTNSYVVYQNGTYFNGQEIQADMVYDMTYAFITGTVRLDRMNSTQAEWLKQGLAKSTSPWKVVMFHQPNEFSETWSGGHQRGKYPRMEWPLAEWGADLVLNGHEHYYERSYRNGVTRLICGIGGESNLVHKDTGYISPYSQARYNHSAVSAAAAPTDYGAVKLIATPTTLTGALFTVTGSNPDNFTLTKEECVTAYQQRPEDQLDEPLEDLADEYPWRRDLVGGGELVDYDTYNPPTADVATVNVGQSVSVFSHTGAQYDVFVDVLGNAPPRFRTQARSLDNYEPGQMAIAYSGTMADLATIDARQKEVLPRRTMNQSTDDGVTALDHGWTDDVDDLDQSMQPGWQLFHFGLVQGVLVADPVKFNGPHHRDGLAAWFPFDEDSIDSLAVSDHSSYAASFEVSDLTPDARGFDPARGRFLSAPVGLSLFSPANRDIVADFAGGFWLRVASDNTTQNTILTAGPAQLDLSGGLGSPVAALYLATAAGGRIFQGSTALSDGWNYVAWAFDGAQSHFYVWPGPTVVSTAVGVELDYSQQVELFSATGFDIQDLRLWNKVKNQNELDLARYHNPTPTAVLYRPAWLQAANNYDRYGVKVLDSGFVTPELLPSAIKTPSTAWVERYDYRGLYEAQSRYKEVGLGSGNTPSPLRYLGVQWDTLTGAGTAVVSTWKGGHPGINAAWLFDSPVPQFMVLQQSGSTPYGIPASYSTSGTTLPWPNPLQATNPNRDRIWVKGEDGFVYEVSVARDGSNNYGLIATKLTASGSYQPTGAEVQLTDTGYASKLTVAGGTVTGVAYSGTVDAPWLFMYGNDEANVSLSGTDAFDAWVNPDGFGSDLGVAALRSNGNISFQSDVQLDPGFYRLEVTSGNVGKVDTNFDGYRVVITVGDIAFEGRLCRGQTGSDFTATDIFDFTVNNTIAGAASASSWLLSFDWSNALRDDRRGVARQLRIDGFSIIRQKTTLYRVRMVGLAPVLEPQGTHASDFPSTPGGWMAAITSWGTVYDYKHESVVYSANDTFMSRQPMSNQLTATTVERREDIILNGSFCLPDPVPPSLPSYSSIVIT